MRLLVDKARKPPEKGGILILQVVVLLFSLLREIFFSEARAASRTQSTIEYLMTYGWSILLIAIVLGVLYYLGLFGSASFSPRARPGTCQVFRPNGPGTSYDAALSGTCQGDLPEYVAQFNGQSSYVSLGNSAAMSPESGADGNMTLCVWYMALSTSSWHGFILKGGSSPSNGNSWEYTIGQGSVEEYIVWNAGGTNIESYGASVPNVNSWHFTCFTYNYRAGNGYVYMDGKQYAMLFSVLAGPATQGTGKLILGAGESGYSNVDLADVQLYNASLDSNTIESLYLEGVGGAPIVLQNLVGWWPLNGNANDYSGNMDNGVATAVSYTSSWASGYYAP